MKKPLTLVTGSSGLIGSALCKSLHESYAVVGLDKEGHPYPPETAEWIFVDLSSDESVMNALHVARDCYGTKIVSVCHLAAYYDFSGEPSDNYEKVTLRGTERLLREMHRFFEVEQFIFSSTMLVHAPTEPGKPIKETSPLEPKWDYPKSKLETEKLILAEHSDIPVVILRIAGVYDDMCHSIPIAHQIQRIFERELTAHVFPGDTRKGQSFVHLEDLVDAFKTAIRKRHELPKKTILLIGEPDTVSYEDLQNLIAQELFGEEWQTRVIPKTVAKAGSLIQDIVLPGDTFIKPWMIDLADDHFELDISEAKRLLGWYPKHKLVETVPVMIKNLKRDPVGWYHANQLEIPLMLKQKSA